MSNRKRPHRVRICADIPPELLARLNAAFDASTHKTRSKFMIELLEKSLPNFEI